MVNVFRKGFESTLNTFLLIATKDSFRPEDNLLVREAFFNNSVTHVFGRGNVKARTFSCLNGEPETWRWPLGDR